MKKINILFIISIVSMVLSTIIIVLTTLRLINMYWLILAAICAIELIYAGIYGKKFYKNHGN